ncbi:hypothetical protein ACFWN1_26510 [Streptomyces sp. NPDC058459]|uniref:hypothetical protein n=1 Tax=Streptomyces sp. NPDC058459 TaxID=3346508 RepID=UPI00364D9CF7
MTEAANAPKTPAHPIPTWDGSRCPSCNRPTYHRKLNGVQLHWGTCPLWGKTTT